MQPMPLSLQLLVGPHTIYALVFALLSGVIAAYLAFRPRKSRATKLLAILFGIWTLLWLHTGLFDSLLWDRWYALAPLAIPLLLWPLAVHLHFAYAFRGNPYPREARLVVPAGYGLVLLLSLHPIYASVVGIASGLTPPPFGDGLSTTLAAAGTILLLSWSLGVYLRKSIRSTREESGSKIPWLQAVWRPVGREARAHRAFLFPWLFVLVGFVLTMQFGQQNVVVGAILFTSLLLLHPCSFILVYLTFAPEPTSVQVKLSGAALVAMLSAFSILLHVLYPGTQFLDYDRELYGFPEGKSIQFVPEAEGGYTVERLPLEPMSADLGEQLDVWSGGRTSFAGGYARVVTGFPFPFEGETYDTLYVGSSPLITLGMAPHPWDMPNNQFYSGPQPKLAPLLLWLQTPQPDAGAAGGVYVRREADRLVITWADVWCCTVSERNTIEVTLSADGTFSFRYPHLGTGIHNTKGMPPFIGMHPGGDAPVQEFNALQSAAISLPAGTALVDNVGLRYWAYVHERLFPLLWVLLGVTVLILVGFPLLLRASLSAPLGRLLDGIRRVDAGERNVIIPVGAEDEVGRITHHFNAMSASLADAESELRTHAEQLEVRVAERTAALERQAEQLKAARAQADAHAEQLRALDALKNRFFANISHELRTPLTLLLGPIKDALDPENDRAMERLRAHLPIMERNAERLLQLIGQLLDLARLEGGGMHLRAREMDLVAFVGALTNGFGGRAARLGLTLIFDPAVSTLAVWADPDKLEKVFVNVLSNALKFTPEAGKVRVRVGIRRYPEGERAEVTVQDTGPGIPAAELPRIFDRFHQVDATATRAHEGAGIGLALARELVELHHGTLTVESTEGFGSTFALRLPFGRDHFRADEISVEGSADRDAGAVGAALGNDRRPDAAGPKVGGQSAAAESEFDRRPATAESKIGRRPAGAETEYDRGVEAAEPAEGAPLVLVVEDNDDMRAYLVSILRPTYRVAEAASGDAGLEATRHLIPDLVVSDIMMPEIDGLALCHSIKADPKLGHIPIVLLTARADEESRLEGLGAGADAYVPKPFSAEELLMRVENLIGVRRLLREQFGGRVVVGPMEIDVPTAEAAWLAEARAVVEEHLADTAFGVERLADELAMSTRQLQRRMMDAVNLTPHGFIRMLRLERAAHLLEREAGSVAEIAYQVGFQKPKYFSKLFREVFGVPPSAYSDHTAE